MLRTSFPQVATAVFPRSNPRKLALLALVATATLAGCGSQAKPKLKAFVGDGYVVGFPQGWQLRHGARLVAAHQGDAVVSVAVAPLPRRFTPALWPQAVKQMDATAKQFAATAKTSVQKGSTEELSGRRGRVYELDDDRRLGFLLVGKREYVLYCRHAGSACDSLFTTFTLAS
jgi:hypothetical protein